MGAFIEPDSVLSTKDDKEEKIGFYLLPEISLWWETIGDTI